MYIWLLMVQGIRLLHEESSWVPKTDNHSYLYFSLEDQVSVAGVRQTKYASKLIHGEIANVPNFQFGRLLDGVR